MFDYNQFSEGTEPELLFLVGSGAASKERPWIRLQPGSKFYTCHKINFFKLLIKIKTLTMNLTNNFLK